ncbi:MAG: hypothetical protein HY927_16950 [Elusimicrobia bacterium]|nr:hypothetical protein [Elusimicrobiota bacterium]
MAPDPYGTGDPEPVAYVVTEDGLTTGPGPLKTAPPAEKPVLGSIALQLSLLGALLAYFLDGNEWLAAAERFVERRQMARVLEPYRAWAEKHPQTYDDVRQSAAALVGKAVAWDVALATAAETPSYYYCEGDPRKNIAWTAEDAKVREAAAGGAPVKVLSRIDGARDEAPLLTVLEVR